MSEPIEPPPPRWRRWLASPWANLVPLVVIFFLAWGAYALYFADRIYPGVRVLGVDVGGLTREQAESRLAERLPILDGDVVLKDPVDRRSWRRPARALGLGDAVDLAEAAYAVAREPETLPEGFLARLFFHPLLWRRGASVPIERLFSFGEAVRGLSEISSAVDVPPQNASVVRDGDRLLAKPSQLGRQLDVTGTLQTLASALEVRANESPLAIDISINRTGARLPDLSSVAEAYNTVTGGDVTMVVRGGEKLIVPAAELKAWTQVEDMKNLSGDVVPTIVIDREAIRAWLVAQQDKVRSDAADARFVISSDGIRLKQGALSAVSLDVDASIDRIIEAAYRPQHLGDLAVRLAASSDSPEGDIGLLTKLQEQAVFEERLRVGSVFGGAAERLQNLAVGSERFNGIAIAPGAEFSFNHYLGAVSAENGYNIALFGLNAEDLIPPAGSAVLLADPTGVIDQLATMAFRLAFWGGLPITERHVPARRQGWVEPPIGLDASADGVARDLKFTNDSSGYLLIVTQLEADRGALTWSLFGPTQTRRVRVPQLTVTGLATPAPPRTIATDLLSGTERIQVSQAREGASATLVRAVDEVPGGSMALGDSFDSRYTSAGDTTIVARRP